MLNQVEIIDSPSAMIEMERLNEEVPSPFPVPSPPTLPPPLVVVVGGFFFFL